MGDAVNGLEGMCAEMNSKREDIQSFLLLFFYWLIVGKYLSITLSTLSAI
jgi:hypothetical protein